MGGNNGYYSSVIIDYSVITVITDYSNLRGKGGQILLCLVQCAGIIYKLPGPNFMI